jgi:phosphatidylglycerol---prolipoprotein diacylglyceryl transferase
MDPTLIEFGPIAIRWYGVMLAVTIGLSIWTAYRYGPRFGVPSAVLDKIAVPFAIVALVGARLGYVLSHPREFRDVAEIVRVDHGGLASHGAIVAGLLYVAWIAHRYRLSLWSLADLAGWAIPIGNIFVRIGNFINGELYGNPTTLPWGVRFRSAPDMPRHPLQIYELLLALVVIAYARKIAETRRFDGQIFWTIVVLTSIGRLTFDSMRSDAQALGSLSLGQIAALVLLGFGARALRLGAQASGSGARTEGTPPGP